MTTPSPRLYFEGTPGTSERHTRTTGVLILLNLALVVCYMPALVVLVEHGALGAETAEIAESTNDASSSDRLALLQRTHRALWQRRSAILGCFGGALLLLLPAALSLTPGFDASFTFASDENTQAIIDRARAPPPDGLFALSLIHI